MYLGDAKDVNSNHFSKITAAYIILDHPKISALVYVDLDTFVRGNGLRIPYSKWLSLMQLPVDVYFRPGQGLHVDDASKKERWAFWSVRGHTFFIRKSNFGFKFLSAWIHARCGFKDQYSLWHATLRLAADARCLPPEVKDLIFSMSYREAMRFNFDVCLDSSRGTPRSFLNGTVDVEAVCMPCATRVHRCPSFRFCADVDITTLFHASIFVGKDLRLFHYDPDFSRRGRRRKGQVAVVDQFAGEGLTNSEFITKLGLDIYRPNSFGLEPKDALTKVEFPHH